MIKERSPASPGRVATYIRWSTDEQGQGTTLEVQKDSCRKFIESQGWQFREDLLFVDDGYSGGSLDRPAMKTLRQAVREGRVDGVVVFKIDRLSRSVIDTVNLVLQEWEGKCFIKSTREPIDTTTAMGKQFFYMLVSYAEWERSVIRERTLSGKRKRAEQGRNAGFTPPYGYACSGDKTIILDDGKANVVKRIFHEYLGGVGFKTVAERLNADGVPSPKGNRWGVNTVRGIITNQAYTGMLVYGKTSVNPAKKHDKAERARLKQANPIVVSNALPRIVTDDEFHAAQANREKRADRKVGRRSFGSQYLLSGLMRCGKCGYGMVGFASQDQRPEAKPRLYYVCQGNRHGVTECDSKFVRKQDAEETVLQYVRREFSLENRTRLIEQAKARYGEEAAATQVALSTYGVDLEGIQSAKKRWMTDYERGIIDGEIVMERLSDLRKKEADLRQKISEAEAMVRAALEKLAVVNVASVSSFAEKLDIWETLDNEQRKHVLRSFVSDVQWYKSASGKETVEINLNTDIIQ